jgi:hypothetical protein
MSCVASVERDDARGIAAFPRTLPCFDAGACCWHRDNLTRRIGKGKRCSLFGTNRRDFDDRKALLGTIYTISCGFGTAVVYRWLRSAKNDFRAAGEASPAFGRGGGIVEVVHSVRIARRVCERQAEKFILRSSLFCHSRAWLPRRGVTNELERPSPNLSLSEERSARAVGERRERCYVRRRSDARWAAGRKDGGHSLW